MAFCAHARPDLRPVLLTSPALGDVVGVASVINGDTIEAHGQRIRLHGIDAPVHAAMRADAMLEKGDMDGYAVWKRILRTVEELQGAKPSGCRSPHQKRTMRGWVQLFCQTYKINTEGIAGWRNGDKRSRRSCGTSSPKLRRPRRRG